MKSPRGSRYSQRGDEMWLSVWWSFGIIQLVRGRRHSHGSIQTPITVRCRAQTVHWVPKTRVTWTLTGDRGRAREGGRKWETVRCQGGIEATQVKWYFKDREKQPSAEIVFMSTMASQQFWVLAPLIIQDVLVDCIGRPHETTWDDISSWALYSSLT